MKSVLSMGWQLLLFRARPEDVPFQPRALGGLVVLNVLLSLLIQQVSEEAAGKPVLQLALLSLLVEAGWLYLLLQRRAWQARWVQGFTGLVLVDLFITLLAAPLALLLRAGDSVLPAVVVIQIVLAFWSLWARGYVYQHTLETGRGMGLLLAFTPLLVVMVLTLQFFPEILPVAAEGN